MMLSSLSSAAPKSASVLALRGGLILLAATLLYATFNLAGLRSAFLLAVGIGLGLTLEGLRFGFAGPWRALITERDSRGVQAQLLAVGLTAVCAFPLLAANPAELTGAHAPVGWAMVGGAFVFGIAMQLVMGCGSGTLVNAGSGNLVGLIALLGFIAGSFFGSLHLAWWTGLGTLPQYTLQGWFGSSGGLWVTLLGLAAIAVAAARCSRPGLRMPPRRLWIAVILLAILAVLNLVIAGQPWGVVYGLGLWGAKIAVWGGADLTANMFWSNPAHADRLQESLLLDATTLTNLGLIIGAFLVMRWQRQPAPQTQALVLHSWFVVVLAGLALGYSARLAFGCNVGAFFSGIATGSLHGWVWLLAAFFGSIWGVRLRPRLLHPAATPSPALSGGVG